LGIDAISGDHLLNAGVVFVEPLTSLLNVLIRHRFDDFVMIPPGIEGIWIIEIVEV
jgi:hypothetical protein